MDTRSKILAGGAEWPRLDRPLAVVTGYFDVLRAEHAREFEQVRKSAATVVAIVLPREGELLPLQARAELVAALRAVDWVACAETAEPAGILATLRPDSLMRLEENDERHWRQLREHVRKRHSDPPAPDR